jgi:hypothetical protein
MAETFPIGAVMLLQAARQKTGYLETSVESLFPVVTTLQGKGSSKRAIGGEDDRWSSRARSVIVVN